MDDELAAFAKAIGHPARVKILRILARQSECICGDVAAELPLAQSTVSQHLKILKIGRLDSGGDRRPANPLLHCPVGPERFKAWCRICRSVVTAAAGNAVGFFGWRIHRAFDDTRFLEGDHAVWHWCKSLSRPCAAPRACAVPAWILVLPRFAADLEWLKSQGVEVERYNLAQQPRKFVETEVVKKSLAAAGNKCLPLVLVDGQIVSEGGYPSRDELAALAGIAVTGK